MLVGDLYLRCRAWLRLRLQAASRSRHIYFRKSPKSDMLTDGGGFECLWDGIIHVDNLNCTAGWKPLEGKET